MSGARPQPDRTGVCLGHPCGIPGLDAFKEITTIVCPVIVRISDKPDNPGRSPDMERRNLSRFRCRCQARFVILPPAMLLP